MMERDRHFFQHAGFTLVELVIVVVVLGILAAVGVMTNASPRDLSIASQAGKIASDIRQVQMLAYATGAPQCVNITGTTVCSAACSTGCSTVSLPAIYGGMGFTGAPDGIKFNSIGQPNITAAATYHLTADTGSAYISVAPQTGFVSISP